MNIFDLQLFASGVSGGPTAGSNSLNVNRTTDNSTGNDLSVTMKQYYDTELLEDAKALLVFNQFAKKQPLPSGRGKTVEWRKFKKFPKALTALTEGVTPAGRALDMEHITVEIAQYGDYAAISDLLDMTAIDPILLETESEFAAQAALTYDTLTRNVLLSDALATNVIYATGSSRAGLTSSNKLTPTLVNKAVTNLKKSNAPRIQGKYVGIVHPSVAEDLRENSAWIEAHKYDATTEIFNGEIGELHGVRFIESTEAPVIAPAVISDGFCRLTVKENASSAATSIKVNEVLTAGSGLSIPCYINGVANTITAIANNTTYSTLTISALSANVSAGAMICGKGAGTDGSAVYPCFFLGKDAYAAVDLEGGGLEMIVKPLGAGNDPLNQRQTAGWKMTHAAKILDPTRIVRVEVGSSYSATDESN